MGREHETTQEIDTEDDQPSSSEPKRHRWDSSSKRDPLPIRQTRINSQVVKRQSRRSNFEINRYTKEEDKKMWHFVNKRIRDKSGNPQKGRFKPNAAIWREFAKKTGSARSADSLHRRYSKYMVICNAPLSKRTRLELYYALEESVPRHFCIELKKRYTLKLDSKGRIEECESDKWADHSKTDDEEVEDSSDDEEPEDPDQCFDSDDEGDFDPKFSLSETRDLWRHILQIVRDQRSIAGKTQKLKVTPDNIEFWKDFEENSGPRRSWIMLANHFRINMSWKVNCAPFDIETKANLYYALHLPVTWDFYNAFKNVAMVRLEPPTTDQEPYIQDYCYKDQSIIRSEWSDLWLEDEQGTAKKVREQI